MTNIEIEIGNYLIIKTTNPFLNRTGLSFLNWSLNVLFLFIYLFYFYLFILFIIIFTIGLQR